MRVKNEIDDDEKGKLFVGGLSWETTQEALQRYFSRYGEVIDCVVMKNSESGRSRGFGFVTFSDPANVTHVLQNGPHQLDGRTIDPKPCNPRTLQKPKRASSYPKVFLGGLPSNVTETDLRSFFTRFGKVQEVVIMYDQEKKKSRGFGFLSFEDDDAVDRCVSEHFVNLNGKQVEIKKAEPRDSSNKMGGDNSWGPPQGGPQMGMGGGGMGMGGPNGQMGGPMSGPMGPMGPGNMMQGYQGWGNTQAQGYPGQWGPTSNQPPVNGYGTPSGPAGYQGWGAPAGPQGQGMAPQWGSNYGGPPQQQGYSSYGPQGAPQSGYGQNWNWNMPQNGPPTGGAPQGPSGAPGPQADMYSRGTGAGAATPSGPGPAAPGAGGAQKAGADYASYGYGGSGYGADSTSYGANRGYGADAGSNSSGGGYGSSHPSVPGQGDGQGASGGYTGGPGPQRGGNYSAPTQSQSFHPYRRTADGNAAPIKPPIKWLQHASPYKTVALERSSVEPEEDPSECRTLSSKKLGRLGQCEDPLVVGIMLDGSNQQSMNAAEHIPPCRRVITQYPPDSEPDSLYG